MARRILARVAALASTTALAGCSLFGIRSGYEQPAYRTLDTLEGGVEVREYGPRLAAETVVRAESEDEARSQAFRILADYIFGANRTSESVAMTAPVAVDESGREIGMTAPVAVEEEGSEIGMTAPVAVDERSEEAGSTASVAAGGEGERIAMRFFMPSRFDRETLPRPTDERVRIVEVPPETLAVLRFSGWRDEQAVDAKQAALREALAGSEWRAAGDLRAFFYDPPWTLPFLRRNEVAVPVERVSGGS